MYQALYRKWRPKSFDDVVGQSHITDTLKQQVSTDRLSHAYLFIGTRGTGKTTCAKILAKAVNCQHPVNGNPCNECSICRGIDDGSIMDVVEMDAASNNGVDNVRQLREEAVFSPTVAKKRVYIIDEVHMLSVSAFNALLKILEEPPAHLMFILATTELNKVPATILSRCQRHSFKRLDTESVVGRLQYVAQKEAINLSPEAAALIAGLSEGGMRDALSMLDQCSGREKIDVETVYSALGLAGNREIARMLSHIANHDTASAIALFSQLWQGGKDPGTLLGELSSLLRDLLMRAVAPKSGRELLSGAYDETSLDSFAKAFSTEELINHINIIQTALADMRAGQAKTVCELCLITLCEPGLGDTLPLLRARVARLEQCLQNGMVPTPAKSVDTIQESAPPAPKPAAQRTPIEEVPFDVPAPKAAPAEPDYRDAPPPHDDRDIPPEPDHRDDPFRDRPPFDPYRDKPASAPIKPLAPSPAPVPAAVVESDDAWEAIKDRLVGVFPPGIQVILTDPTKSVGILRGDELTLYAFNEFFKNQIDRPDVADKIRAVAAQYAGRPISVLVTSDAPPENAAPAPAAAKGSKLDELAKFSVVKFK